MFVHLHPFGHAWPELDAIRGDRRPVRRPTPTSPRRGRS
jgi:hypothetical protein